MPLRPGQVFDNVVVQPRDAREASDVFYRQRIGDVLLTYENEVVLTNQVGAPLGAGGGARAKAHTRHPPACSATTPRRAAQRQVYGDDKALPYVVPSPNVRISCPLALVRPAGCMCARKTVDTLRRATRLTLCVRACT